MHCDKMIEFRYAYGCEYFSSDEIRLFCNGQIYFEMDPWVMSTAYKFVSDVHLCMRRDSGRRCGKLWYEVCFV